jgi:hypothetical protein
MPPIIHTIVKKRPAGQTPPNRRRFNPPALEDGEQLEDEPRRSEPSSVKRPLGGGSGRETTAKPVG